MALLWLEGFEGFSGASAVVGADLAQKYPGSTTTNALTTSGRFSGTAVSGGSSGGAMTLFTPDFTTPTDDYILGCAVRWKQFPAAPGHPVLSVFDGATRQSSVHILSTGLVAFYRGGTQVAASTERLRLNRWYYLELKVKIGNAGVGSYEIRVDGVNVLSNGSVDTQQTATSQATKAALEFDNITTAGNQQVMDDVYVCDDTGSANNDFLGDQAVEGLFPSAEGDVIDFTPSTGTDNSALVEEVPSDDNTTYVESATVGHQDLYQYTDLTLIDSIRGVQVNTVAFQNASETLITLVKTGTTTDGDAGQAVDTAYEELHRILEQDPDTAAAWTDTGVNGAQFGVEVG